MLQIWFNDLIRHRKWVWKNGGEKNSNHRTQTPILCCLHFIGLKGYSQVCGYFSGSFCVSYLFPHKLASDRCLSPASRFFFQELILSFSLLLIAEVSVKLDSWLRANKVFYFWPWRNADWVLPGTHCFWYLDNKWHGQSQEKKVNHSPISLLMGFLTYFHITLMPSAAQFTNADFVKIQYGQVRHSFDNLFQARGN